MKVGDEKIVIKFYILPRRLKSGEHEKRLVFGRQRIRQELRLKFAEWLAYGEWVDVEVLPKDE